MAGSGFLQNVPVSRGLLSNTASFFCDLACVAGTLSRDDAEKLGADMSRCLYDGLGGIRMLRQELAGALHSDIRPDTELAGHIGRITDGIGVNLGEMAALSTTLGNPLGQEAVMKLDAARFAEGRWQKRYEKYLAKSSATEMAPNDDLAKYVKFSVLDRSGKVLDCLKSAESRMSYSQKQAMPENLGNVLRNKTCLGMDASEINKGIRDAIAAHLENCEEYRRALEPALRALKFAFADLTRLSERKLIESLTRNGETNKLIDREQLEREVAGRPLDSKKTVMAGAVKKNYPQMACSPR